MCEMNKQMNKEMSEWMSDYNTSACDYKKREIKTLDPLCQCSAYVLGIPRIDSWNSRGLSWATLGGERESRKEMCLTTSSSGKTGLVG